MAQIKLVGVKKKQAEKTNFSIKSIREVVDPLKEVEQRLEKYGHDVSRNEIVETFMRQATKELTAWLDKPEGTCRVPGVERKAQERQGVQLVIDADVANEFKVASDRLVEKYPEYEVNRTVLVEEAFRRFVKTATAQLDAAEAAEQAGTGKRNEKATEPA